MPSGDTNPPNLAALRAVKLLHTVVWVFFASSTLAITVCAVARRFELAALFVAVVLVEVLVLGLNGLSCPLTAVTARYRGDMPDDSDIYMVPGGLVRHNKLVFGALYVVGIVLTAALWATR